MRRSFTDLLFCKFLFSFELLLNLQTNCETNITSKNVFENA